MQLPIAGQAYEHPSRDANYQRSINMFPSPTGDQTVPLIQLQGAGLTELVDLGGNEVRAIMKFDEKLYVIVDETVYLVTVAADGLSATSSSIGTISGSDGRISWARNPTQIMFVDGSSNGYIITASTDTLAQITDTDFTGGDFVVFMDSYFIYNTPNAATMYATAQNDGTDITATDVATAEASPDDLKALIVDKRELWAIGDDTTEVWFDAANATGFPFSVRDGAIVDQGTSAPHSVLKVDNTILWLDDRRFLVQVQGYGIKVVSTPAISAIFQTYDKVDDAFAIAYKDRGHQFYQITFPTEEKTWVYDLITGQWHERSYQDPETDTATRHLANCHIVYNNANIVGAYNSGKLYILSSDYLDDDGAAMHKLRTTSHFTSELNQMGISSLELHAESGEVASGLDPQISLRYSNDGGYSWSHSLPRSIGKIGEHGKRVRWNRLGSGREWIFEFTCADAIPLGLMQLYAIMEGDGQA